MKTRLPASLLLIGALGVAGWTRLAAQSPVRVKVDWARPGGTTPEPGYGTNIFTGLAPAVSSQPSYIVAMREMSPRVLRLHSNSMVRLGDDKCWLNSDAASWNAPKIAAVFDHLAAYRAEIIVNIPGWPAAWCQPGSKMLDPARYDDYARLCGQLVDLVNNRQNRGVTYWENVNEREVEFPATKEGMAALGEIFRRSAAAMRQASPIPIKVSPAWMNLSQQQRLELFLDVPGVRDNLGFFAFHQYATPRGSDLDGSDARNQHVFDRAAEIASGVKRYHAVLAQRGLGGLLMAYDEYNLAATYDADPKHLMHGPIAMVFSALLQKHIAETGLNVWMLSWNERDGAYGLMDEAGRLRPNGAFLAATNRYLCGRWFPTESSDPHTVEAFAVDATGHQRAVLLINRGAAPSRVTLSMTGWKPTSATWVERRIGSSSTAIERSGAEAPTTTLDPYSVALCLFSDPPASGHAE